MRRYILSMAMAVFAFVTLLPLKAVSAEESKEKKESGADKAWINCVSEDGAASVNLHFPGATEKRIATFRLKLYVDAEPEVEFSEEARKRARVCESRYNSETNILSIYVSARRSSVDYPVFKNDSLKVCSLTVVDSEGKTDGTGVHLADSEDAFRVVCGKEAVNMVLEDRTGEEMPALDDDSAGASQAGGGNADARLPYIAAGTAGIAIAVAAAGVVYRRHKRGASDNKKL